MRYYPVFMDTRGSLVAVFGGGEVALAKLRLLVRTEAKLRVVARELCPAIAQYISEGRVSWSPHASLNEILAQATLVYVATGDGAGDAEIAAAARQARVPVNVVDGPDQSSIISPAIVDRAPVVVAIGTEGGAPVLARQIKADIERLLSPRLGELVMSALPHREKVSKRLPGRQKRAFWEGFYAGTGAQALTAGGAPAVSELIERLLTAPEPSAAGRVALVGAGPGDPELLTLQARKLLHTADVVLYDRLVDKRILELARREAVWIEVGKTQEGQSWKQDEIDALMVAQARTGAFVVRLKSGDPMMFGRADEEIAACRLAKIPVAVVPGITAAAAAAASIGVSMTRRRRNSSITFLTARDVEGFAEHDWKMLAGGTACAVYMGVRAAKFLQGRLLLHGAKATTSVTIVENASRPSERIVDGQLGQLSELIARAEIAGPAIIFVGLGRAAEEAATAGSQFTHAAAGAF
jgi:uroporphyrin-III C-methyltransferase / precorrin-2 dehydrogenase / sirohydrochlorin ferrochelatase